MIFNSQGKLTQYASGMCVCVYVCVCVYDIQLAGEAHAVCLGECVASGNSFLMCS
jgi:hypothetical protein